MAYELMMIMMLAVMMILRYPRGWIAVAFSFGASEMLYTLMIIYIYCISNGTDTSEGPAIYHSGF